MSINDQKIEEIFSKFKDLRVLVLGDVMIDAYIWGSVERISPEAPVPVLSASKKEQRLGGAANVAKNIVALGAEVVIASVVGNDNKAEDLKELLEKNTMTSDGLVYSTTRKTSVKTRVISDGQHVVRVDDEDHHDLDQNEENAILERIESLMVTAEFDVLIFEDYNKGVLTESVIQRCIALAKSNNIPTCVDPKKENFFAYEGVDLFKPNLKELAEGLKVELNRNDLQQIENAIDQLQEKIGAHITLLTLSENGVFVKSTSGPMHLPAHVRNIADVSGAGDTVISVAALCLTQGLDQKTMAGMANLAGGLVCEKVGVVPIDAAQLKKECLEAFKSE